MPKNTSTSTPPPRLSSGEMEQRLPSARSHALASGDLTRRDLVKAGVVGLAALVPAVNFMKAAAPAATAAAGRGLRFGVNYVPRKNWWYGWLDWDGQAVREDFEAIRELGMDHIRIQCLWPVFQPGINYVSSEALERLHELLDLAQSAQLDVEVAVLDGWLSGYAFMPAWVTPLATDTSHNVFIHPEIIEAEKLLFTAIGRSVGGHQRFLGFDLGNEIGVLQEMAGLNSAVTPEQADRWATTMLAYCLEICPGKFHVNGVDDSHWFSDIGFSRENLGRTGSATVVHCYAYWTGALDHYRYDDAGNLHLAEYMVELARAYHRDPQRAVWVQEVGTSEEWMPEAYMPEYASKLLQNAAECQRVWGFTWWCSHDINPAMKGFLSLEYGLGLLDQRNRMKPLGKALSGLFTEWRKHPPAEIARPVALVIPDRGLSKKSGSADWSLATQYMDLVKGGVRPAIVLESRVDDKGYLQSRGIEELIRAKVG